ncbi:MAG: ribosome silencing factor [Bacteroidetes bacterium]|nr:MAG: ribosome silencing factor [Bacteroidota bacterium]
MSKQNRTLSSEQLSQVVVKGMQEIKAEDIVVMDLRSVNNAVADFFVICSGNSDTHIDAIAESVDKEVHKIDGQNPWHREGQSNKIWVLLDYVDVVVHVFKHDNREFYGLESLWGDAKITTYDEVTESKF